MCCGKPGPRRADRHLDGSPLAGPGDFRLSGVVRWGLAGRSMTIIMDINVINMVISGITTQIDSAVIALATLLLVSMLLL